MNELVKGLSQNDVVTYPRAFLRGYTQMYTQILDLPLRGIRRIPAHRYTTTPLRHCVLPGARVMSY